MPDIFDDNPETTEKTGEDIRWWIDRMLSWGTDRSDQGQRLWGETRSFVEDLRIQTYASVEEVTDKDFSEDEYDTPGGRYVGELAASAERGAQRYLDSFEQNPRRTAEEIACCLLQGIFTQLSAEQREIAGEGVQWVNQSNFRSHARDIRLILDVMESMSSPGVSARWDLRILNKDFSATARQGAERALFAPAVLFLSQSERFMVQMSSRVRREIARTRCQPVVRLWGAVSSWLFGRTDGLFWNLKSFCTQASARIHREMKNAVTLPGSTGSSATGGASYSLSLIRVIKEALDLIIDGADALQRCRLPYRQTISRAREAGQDPEDGEDPAPRDELPEREDSLPPGRNDPADANPASDDPFPPDFRIDTDPILGPIAESPLEEGRLYLTRPNMTRVLIEAGTPPERALEAARGRNCQDSLSSETIDALASAGIEV